MTTPRELFDNNLALAYRVALPLCRCLGLQSIDADAVCTAALKGLWKAAGAFDASRGLRFSTLAFKCCRRAAVEELRRLRQWRPVTLTDLALANIPDRDTPALTDLPPCVTDALERLDARSRSAVMANVAHGKTLTDLGTEFGVSKARVGQIVAHALRKLRREVCATA